MYLSNKNVIGTANKNGAIINIMLIIIGLACGFL